jgi:hypothetical protein
MCSSEEQIMVQGARVNNILKLRRRAFSLKQVCLRLHGQQQGVGG